MNFRSLATLATIALTAGLLAPATAAEAATSTISGVVQSQGEAVSRIRVGWFEPSTGMSDYVYSRANGTFSIESPPAGKKFIVYANVKFIEFEQTRVATEYLGAYYGESNAHSYAYQTLAPYVSGTDESVTVDLSKPGAITGNDPALAGQHIGLLNAGGGSVRLSNGDYSVEADSVGTFTFPSLVPGTFTLEKPDEGAIASVSDAPIVVTEGTTTTVDPLVRKASAISGRVVDSAGKGVAQVYVDARNSLDRSGTWTNSRGYFTVTDLSEKNYRLTIAGVRSSRSPLPSTKTIYVAKLESGETRTVNARLKLGGTITGSVTHPDRSVAFVLDNHKRMVVSSYEKKHFSFSGFESGAYTVIVKDLDKQTYSRTKVTLGSGKTVALGLQQTKRKTVTLTGRLRGVDQAGRSHSYVAVTSRAGGGDDDIEQLTGGYATASRAGVFSLKGIIPGTYDVVVSSRDHATKVTSSVSLRKSTTKVFSQGSRLTPVRGVVKFDGAPVNEGDIWISQAGQPESDYLSMEFSDGSLKAFAPAGTYSIHQISTYSMDDDDAAAFQSGSPFWRKVPDSQKTFTVEKNVPLNLGTIELELADH